MAEPFLINIQRMTIGSWRSESSIRLRTTGEVSKVMVKWLRSAGFSGRRMAGLSDGDRWWTKVTREKLTAGGRSQLPTGPQQLSLITTRQKELL